MRGAELTQRNPDCATMHCTRRLASALLERELVPREFRLLAGPAGSARPVSRPGAERTHALAKQWHEIRDPIHVFIRLETPERKLLDSPFLQRLRHIHQLALTNLIYPGASHTRFEHSLGVMDLASRVYDTLMASPVHKGVAESFPTGLDHIYWKRAVRMAALCHDVGHLPFSHAAEDKLLPEGWNHDRISAEMIRAAELEPIWRELHLNVNDVAKLAVGPKHWVGEPFTDWEAIFSEIIRGDALGVDRIDYLLRDSHHAGVAYGRFDHYRLVDTMRVLPREEDGSSEPILGIEEGGIYSAEALVLARYFMYSQLYFHPVRRIYDIHLQEFLSAWLPGGKFPTTVAGLLEYSDVEVLAALRRAADSEVAAGHESARRIIYRDHFRLLYERNPKDQKENLEAAKQVFRAAVGEYGESAVRLDTYPAKGGAHDFPVLARDGRIVPSVDLSPTLRATPLFAVDFVFVQPDLRATASRWLKANLQDIIRV